MGKAEMRPAFFMSATNYRAWLEARHAECQELWVGFYKKSSGKPSITYPEALDEALCYGWIDGVRRSVGHDAYTVRFTPRKARSQWSAVNIRRAQELADQGRMHPAGLQAFEGAKHQPRNYSYETTSSGQISSRAGEAISRQPSCLELLSESASVVPAHGHLLGNQRHERGDAAETPRHSDR